LLACPFTFTTTGPVPAVAGTEVTIRLGPQLVGVAETPLKVTVLDPCVAPKFEPLMATEVPAGPDEGVRLEMEGPIEKETPLLEILPTVTNTRPVVAPDGTGTVIFVFPQAVGDACTPLKVTVLAP